MTTYPTTPSLSPAPALTDEATLTASLDCLLEHLPMTTTDATSPQTVFEILLRAASRQDSIEHTCQHLTGAPTGKTIHNQLEAFDDLAKLEGQVNQALQSRLPSRVARRKHKLAIDLHLVPYYGTPTDAERPYIYRSQAKAGTTSFFAYATVYVIRRHKRVTLAIHPVHRQETFVATVSYLLAALSRCRIGIKCLLLDRGFYSVPVIRWLKCLRIPFVMPAIIRGKQGGTRQLLRGRKSYRTPYTITSPFYGGVDCQMAVVCQYHQGRRGQHGIAYQLYVVFGVKVALAGLAQFYRSRFGIETSYRLKNLSRIRTTTKNPVLRFLFMAIAFILVNLWVYLLWWFISHTQPGGRVVYTALFPLKTMLAFLSQAIERHFPVVTAIFLPSRS